MTTIAQLQTSVDAWLVRDDVAVSGGDFSQILLLAESEIALEYRFGIQETSTTLTFTGQSENLPADYLSARTPFIDDNTRRFEYKTPEAIRQSLEWKNGRAGQSYTIEGGDKDVDSTGDDRMAVTIAGPASAADPLAVLVYYYRRFPALNTGVPTGTNWLLQNHFNVYLFETLLQAAIYIQEPELAAKYLAMVANPIEAPGLPLGLRRRIAKNENRKRFGTMPKQSYGNPRVAV